MINLTKINIRFFLNKIKRASECWPAPVNIERKIKVFFSQCSRSSGLTGTERLDGRVMRGRTGRGYASCGAVTTTLLLHYLIKKKRTFSLKNMRTHNTKKNTSHIYPVCLLVAQVHVFFSTRRGKPYTPPPPLLSFFLLYT